MFSTLLIIANAVCGWGFFLAGFAYSVCCVRGMLNGKAFTPLACLLFVASIIVMVVCGEWIVCH